MLCTIAERWGIMEPRQCNLVPADSYMIIFACSRMQLGHIISACAGLFVDALTFAAANEMAASTFCKHATPNDSTVAASQPSKHRALG